MKQAYETIVWTSLLLMALTTPAALAADTDTVAPSYQLASRSPVPVTCGDGFQGNRCDLALEAIGLSLKYLKVQLSGWRVIVVPANQWNMVAARLGVRSAPAFSDLTTTTTYLSSGLVFPQAGMDTELRELTSRIGMSRLRWVLAHEYGHLVCNTHDEKKAERAAGALEYGNANVCE